MGSNSSESAVVRGYIETLLAMPWDKMSRDNQNIEKAKEILQADHYGLEKSERKDPGISGGPRADQKRRKSDPVSDRTAGYRKDFHCPVGGQGIE